METIKFKASYDTLTKIISFGLLIIFIIIGQYPARNIISGIYNYSDFIPLGILSFIVIVTYIFSPQKCILTNESLIIKMLLFSKKIKLSDISEIKILDNNEIKGSIRTFASGGLFGYYGYFYNSAIGKYIMYATQRKNLILIKTKEAKKIIVTPDDTTLIDRIKDKL